MLMMPAYDLMDASVIGIISVIALHETAKKPLKGSPPAVATHSEAQAVLHGHRVASERDDHLPEGTTRAAGIDEQHAVALLYQRLVRVAG